jgi:hypothetical protein
MGVVTRAARFSSETRRAMPKSSTFTVKGTPRRRDTAMYTLSGLTSEWMIPTRCARPRASQSWPVISSTPSAGTVG